MIFKKVLDQLNIFSHCKKYGLPFWQCPQLLFIIMGASIGVISVIAYLLGTRYILDPATASMITLFLAAFLLVINFIVVQSLERMAEASRMKSEFINIVSHQLRSPLTNLKWSIEILMSGELGEVQKKQLEYFRILTENTKRMTELVSDLLVVSRIEQGRLLFQKSEFFLAELAKEIIDKYRPYAAASNIEIKVEAEPSLPKITADPSQIRLISETLTDNAIRYIKGRGEIKIKIAEKEGRLSFTIADNGVGIPAKDQKHIFQKFFRSANILKHQTEGSGLGLYIAKSIIEKLNGKMGFSSQEGRGSTFWFILPIKS